MWTVFITWSSRKDKGWSVGEAERGGRRTKSEKHHSWERKAVWRRRDTSCG